MTIHLRAAKLTLPARIPETFPFTVPPIRAMDEIAFESPVTFFVGENGSGKSTLLEGLAAAIGSITVGAENVDDDPTLSPMRQLTLLSMIKQMVEEHAAQFIIATHSPILMAYPGAAIYSFDGGTIQPVEYESLEHVAITRAFLSNPDQFLRHL